MSNRIKNYLVKKKNRVKNQNDFVLKLNSLENVSSIIMWRKTKM